MKKTLIILKSPTYSTKARRLISQNGIYARAVKLDSNADAVGCKYGVEVYTRDLYTVYALLREAEIEYTLYREAE